MPRRYLGLPVAVLMLITTASLRADDWPVPRGPSREPMPYRYDPKKLPKIPREFRDEAQACVLYSGTTHLIETDGTVEAITHEITRLNSRKGIEKLGEYRSISYDPTYEKLTLNEARVIKANGAIVAIEPRHVQLRDVATDFQVYDQDKQLVISFPNLEVGDAYEVKWTVRGKNREFNGDFFARYTFGDDTNPVLRDEFRVRVPKNKTLKYATVNGDVDLKISDSAGDKFYSWTTTNRAELSHDEDRPSKEELRLQLAVSTFPTWEAVAQWKQKLRAECWTCTPEVRKIIDEATKGQKTQIDKAKALTYWVRRHVRYLSRGPGGLGYTPHLPHLVLANLYGDCKDQAQLLAVMLREIGLPASLVTLGTLDDGQILPEVPSPWGSHAILLTKIDGKEYWIDTTVSLAAWDFLPRADRDRQTYVTKDAELKLMRTPPFTYEDYRIDQTTHVAVQSDGSSLCKRQSTYYGSAAWSRRDKWVDVPAGERRRTAAAELQDSNGKARLLALKIDDKLLHNFDLPVTAAIEYEIPKHFTGEAIREGSFTDSPIWTWFLGYNIDLDRDLPFQLPTPFESIHRYIVELPPAYRADTLPQDKEIISPWGFFKLKVSPDAGDAKRVVLHMQMRLEKNRIEKDDFARFVQFQDDVSRAYRVWLNLRPVTDAADAPALEKLLAQGKPAEAQTIKILGRLYIDNDRMADARRILEQGTKWFPEEKALWDLRVRSAENSQHEELLHREMVKQFPAEPSYAVALGAACVRRGELAEADAILTPLTKNASAAIQGEAHYQLARSAFRQHNAAGALKHLNAALMHDPPALASMEAMQFKARVQEKLGLTKEAVQTLETALEAEPNARDVLEFIVELERKAGQREAALDHLRRYTVTAGNDPAMLVKAAALHYDMNRYEEALDLASRAARQVGGQAPGRRIMGLVYLQKQDYAQAAYYLDLGDLDGPALAGLLTSLMRIGDLDAAQRRAELIPKLGASVELALRGKEVALLADRRDLLLKTWAVPNDQRAAARRVVNQFVCAERGLAKRWPHEQVEHLTSAASRERLEFAPLLALQGWLAVEKGQLRSALADAASALKLNALEARAHLVRGRVRLEQGNSVAALVDLRKATEISQGGDPVILHWLAAALLDAGRTKEAVETQRLALLLRPDDSELREQLRQMETAPRAK